MAAPARPNIVLITLDTTRADHLGAWGWPHARTPVLDGLAARGTRFSRCDSAAPITLPSHSTILTGLYPPRHGVRDNGTFALSPAIDTVPELLQRAGYDTAAVVSAVVLHRRHRLDQGFRIYDDDLGAGYSAGTEVGERNAEAATAAALTALGQLRAPYFLWLHYFDPHEEYRPPTPWADGARGPTRLYDAEIAYMDQAIGKLLAALAPDTAVVVVGDHGEMLGDHGETSHGLLLAPGARRVPLILAGPGVPAGRIEECLVRTADVAPTLLGWAGLVPPPGLDGEALLPLPAPAGRCARASYSESFLPFFAYKWYPLRALSDGHFLYLQAPRPSLYRIASDPEEAHDIGAEHPAVLERWRERLRAALAAAGEGLEPTLQAENLLDEGTRAKLQSLGYLAGGAGGAVSAELPDPRRMTATAQALHDAAIDIQRGRCPQALPRLQEIVRADPHNFPALTLAGECLRDAGRESDALGLFVRASKENELSAVPVANAAGSLLKLGRRAEAEKEFRRALALDPTLAQAATHLARIERERGDPAAALATLGRALEAGAHAPEIYLERGTLHAEAGRLEQALGDFREAARRSPQDLVPLENAARAAYHLERPREAAQIYEAALRLADGRGDLWKTLGAIYHFELAQPADAERCFRRALALESDPQVRAELEALLRGK